LAAFITPYDSLNSLALSGQFVITNEQTYECKLQVFYIAPDSFAFLAEGTLGADIARGALINGVGFWEIPREDYYEKISIGDQIAFGDVDIAIDLDILLNAIFYFKNTGNFHPFDIDSITIPNDREYYKSNDAYYQRIITLDRSNAMAISQIIVEENSPNNTVAEIKYDNWRIYDKIAIPEKIGLVFVQDGIRVEYQIDRVKLNPAIALSFFSPKL